VQFSLAQVKEKGNGMTFRKSASARGSRAVVFHD